MHSQCLLFRVSMQSSSQPPIFRGLNWGFWSKVTFSQGFQPLSFLSGLRQPMLTDFISHTQRTQLQSPLRSVTELTLQCEWSYNPLSQIVCLPNFAVFEDPSAHIKRFARAPLLSTQHIQRNKTHFAVFHCYRLPAIAVCSARLSPIVIFVVIASTTTAPAIRAI